MKIGQAELLNLDEDIQREYKEAHDPSKVNAISIIDAKKEYKKFLRSGTKAIDGVSFVSPKGSCLGLLGDNGAGKSTTIGVLSGITKISSGDMKVLGLSVKYNKSLIRDNMGVTLQDNILWPDLTAGDHIRLFAQMKGLGWKETRKEVRDRLKEVGLYHVRNDLSKTFSGGMKRRLCVAMAYVGKRSLILLDEPTTGLDPSSKRDVWDLISDKKSKCSTILTTHSMEEADSLSDKIVIMKKGRLICSGDSLHLKAKYNSGYVLKFIALDGKEEVVKDFIKTHFPHSICIVENAGNFIFNIKHEFFSEMIDGLKSVEKELNNSSEGSILKDFGISHSTLEDVYLKVNQEL